MYCNRASAIEENNKITEKAEAFVKKNNTTQKRPKKKVNITKSTNSMGILEEVVKYVQSQEIKTGKFLPKKPTVYFRTKRKDFKAPGKQGIKKKMKKSISRTSKLFLAFS